MHIYKILLVNLISLIRNEPISDGVQPALVIKLTRDHYHWVMANFKT